MHHTIEPLEGYVDKDPISSHPVLLLIRTIVGHFKSLITEAKKVHTGGVSL
jgi:hypothetical protein